MGNTTVTVQRYTGAGALFATETSAVAQNIVNTTVFTSTKAAMPANPRGSSALMLQAGGSGQHPARQLRRQSLQGRDLPLVMSFPNARKWPVEAQPNGARVHDA